MGKTASPPPTHAVPAAKAATTPVRVRKKAAVLGDMDDVCKWLLERTDVERINPSRLAADALKLDRMHRLMELLGNPHRTFKSVHVAGTKGKGSTCEMTAAMLEGCGYTVGLYTSPHLMSIRERIRLNRGLISERDFVATAQRVAGAEQQLTEQEGEPTFFELTTAMAFVFFSEQAVDVAVVEVGLGGRLDSTNVLTPEVTAITSISLDHTQILGGTVEKIAREKAGIFKPGVPAVTVAQKPGVIEALRQEAERAGTTLAVLGQEVDYSARFEARGVAGGTGIAAGPHMRVSVSGARTSYEHMTVPLRGEHQAVNCGLALAILDALSERGFRTPEDRVTRGLATVSMAGRMEMAKTSPRVMVDGAHNAESVRCLMKALNATVPYDSLVVVFGCASDKDIDGMLEELSHGADKVIFTRSINARAADPRELSRRFTETSGKMCQAAPDAEAAMELAKRAVGREDLICVTGSFYLVSDVRKLLGMG
jgi:dihydrofolate synthase/folylpolyglutamate synthase